jgi:hypothetical protein
MGMMADEPELMDRVCELAMQARKQSRMRPVDGYKVPLDTDILSEVIKKMVALR